jgi:hypothetical protein
MTMPFYAVALAALATPSLPNHGIYSYSNANQAPTIISMLLAKLILDELTMLFNTADRQRIHQAELPTDKAFSDEVFSTASANGRLTCHFEIQSARRMFHPI